MKIFKFHLDKSSQKTTTLKRENKKMNRSKQLIKTLIKCLFIVFIITSCNKRCNCESINKNVADGQTLYKICKYLKENDKLVEPANPCEWKIREKKNDVFQGKQVFKIKMTCCFMGDELIIDKKSNKVIGYIPSDK